MVTTDEAQQSQGTTGGAVCTDSGAPEERAVAEEAGRSKQHLLLKQFDTLGQEILELKARVIRIQFLAITAIPVMLGIGEQTWFHNVLVFVPFLSCGVVLVLIFRQRCGACNGCSHIRAAYLRTQLHSHDCATYAG